MSLKSWLNESPGAKLEEAEAARSADDSELEDEPFDPLTEVSADAKYIVRRLVLWFLVLPVLLGLLILVINSASH